MQRTILLTLLLVFPFFVCVSQEVSKKKHSFYFSWGYNKEWYTKSTVHVEQSELGNDYDFVKVTGHDHPGWDDQIFNKPVSIPQYNYRIGYFFNEKKNLALEINFDHTKFIIQNNQSVHIKGSLENSKVDSTILFSDSLGFHYFLNNGANFLLFNIVKRWHWIASKSGKLNIDFLAKAGVGPVIPHVDNSLFGYANSPGFQIGGWNIGIEGAIRMTFFNYVYLEYCNKLDYASYYNLHVYKGTANQSFGTYEMILNLGVSIPMK